MLPLSSATWINATQGCVANQRGQLGAAPSDRDPKGGREKLTSFFGETLLGLCWALAGGCLDKGILLVQQQKVNDWTVRKGEKISYGTHGCS